MGRRFGAPAFLLDDDLGQDRIGQVFAGLGVVDHEVALCPHHFGRFLERHIGACVGIVEPAVGVFLDDDRPALLLPVPCHVSDRSYALGPDPGLLYAATARSVARSLCTAPEALPRALTGPQP